MIAELSVVRLVTDLPEHGLSQGAVGTVVLVHSVPDLAYEVEFRDGQTFAVKRIN